MKKDFISKNISHIAEIIEYSAFTNRYAERNGFLQNLEPRVKLLSFLSLLVITGLEQRIAVLGLLYVLILLLAVFSKIPVLFFIKRVWIFIPLFTGLIVLPAIFNFITPGKPVLTLAVFSKPHTIGPFLFPSSIAVTDKGINIALKLILRVATSVSIVILLIVTTSWVKILKAFTVLRVPDTIIFILMMTYRYIFLFLHTIEAMFLARKSRQINDYRLKEAHAWIASRIGVLIGKSYHLSNDVHMAMISRGWTGSFKVVEKLNIRFQEIFWSIFTAGIITLWVLF